MLRVVMEMIIEQANKLLDLSQTGLAIISAQTVKKAPAARRGNALAARQGTVAGALEQRRIDHRYGPPERPAHQSLPFPVDFNLDGSGRAARRDAAQPSVEAVQPQPRISRNRHLG
jgi:hypothetical protein